MLTSLLFMLTAVAQLPGETEFLAGDEAQRAGQWATAIPHFESAGQADPQLKPFTELRIARSQQNNGDANGAETRLRQVIALPAGPWSAIAQARLAALLVQKNQLAESVQLHDQFIKLPVEPWWLDDMAQANADVMMRLPDRRNDALDYFREVALNNIYPKERILAAGKLLGSNRGDDLAAAALGYFRSAAPSDAAKALKETAGPLLSAAGASGLSIRDLALLLSPEAGTKDNPFESVAKAHPESLWVRAWLVLAARTHGEDKRFDAARMAAFAIADTWPTERDTGDTLNWLAGKVEAAQGFDAAVPLYYKMAAACPAHHHADDGMLHVGDVYAGRGNKAEALKAYDVLGTLKDAKLQDLGYYKAAVYQLAQGDEAGAKASFQKAASLAPGKFYAHRALQRLGAGTGENLKVDGANAYLQPAANMQGTPPAPAPLVVNAPQFQRLRFFGKYGLEEGEWEALDLLEKLHNDPAHAAIYQLIAETGFAHTALQFANAHKWGLDANGDKTLALRRLELPRAYWPEVTELGKQTGVDPYLILAISKQESTFRATVVSRVGASGVMQLMPKTAAWLAEKDPDIPPGTTANLKCPANSICLGANYLGQMIERSGGNLVYAVASYNGGPGNVDKWRKLTPTQDLDAWIDAIPYEETQDYVRKVLGYYMAYHSLYPPA